MPQYAAAGCRRWEQPMGASDGKAIALRGTAVFCGPIHGWKTEAELEEAERRRKARPQSASGRLQHASRSSSSGDKSSHPGHPPGWGMKPHRPKSAPQHRRGLKNHPKNHPKYPHGLGWHVRSGDMKTLGWTLLHEDPRHERQDPGGLLWVEAKGILPKPRFRPERVGTRAEWDPVKNPPGLPWAKGPPGP